MSLREILSLWYVQTAIGLLLLYIARRIIDIKIIEIIRIIFSEFRELLLLRPTIGALDAAAIAATLIVGTALLAVAEMHSAMVFVLGVNKSIEFERSAEVPWLFVGTVIVAGVSVAAVACSRRK